LRRDPFAMLPFCGYNMNDYFAHWLDIGKTLKNPPRIYNVNWFQKKNGRFLWPGFGDNMRVIDWIIDRCEGKDYGTKTPIGIVPKVNEINQNGLNASKEDLEQILSVDKNLWKEEISDIEHHYEKFGSRLPKELTHELDELKKHIL